MIEPESLSGLWCATLTPLDRYLGIDQPRLAAHVNGLLAEAVDGVVLFGTMGEGPSFSVAERCDGLDGLLAAGIAASRIVTATGCAALTDTLLLTRHALQAGCPRCLVLPAFFWKNLSDEAVYRYYANLIEEVDDHRLRLYLYHIPQISAVPVRPQVVARLAVDYPGIIAGVKDSSGDFAHTAELLDCAANLSIMGGYEPQLPQLMRGGGAGTICGIANLAPSMAAALLRPDADTETVNGVQAFLDIVFRYPLVSAFKAVYAAQTGDDAWRAVRPPLLPLTAAEHQQLFASLAAAGFDVSDGGG